MKAHVIVATLAVLLMSGVVVAQDADLIKAAKSGEEKDRLQAIDRLGIADDASAVPVLVELLRDPSMLIRAHAAHALGEIGPEASSALRPLIRAAVTGEPIARREAFKAIRKIRPASPLVMGLMLRALKSDEPAIRSQARSALTRAGKAAVPTLIRALDDDATDFWAAMVLSELGEDAAPAVPALIKMAKDDEKPEDRREAILALAMIGPKAAPAVDPLIEIIKARHSEKSKEIGRSLVGPAVFALGRIGPDAKAALPALQEMLKDPDLPKEKLPIATAAIAWATAKVDPENEDLANKAVALLAPELKADDAKVREFAIHALVELQPDPEVARPLIGKALEGSKPEVVAAVVDAFIKMKQPPVSQLVEILEDAKLEVARARIVHALGKMGDKAKEAVPALIKAAGNDDEVVRREALFALAEIGPNKDCVDIGIKALDDNDEDVRYSAVFLLGTIGPDAAAAKERLVKNLKVEDDEFMPMAAAWALSHIDPSCTETATVSVPCLMKALTHHEQEICLEAIEALGRLGPEAKAALPELKKLAECGDPLVEKHADDAIKAIEK